MKKFIKSLLLSLSLFFLFYLLASFYSISFDISKWTEPTRGIVSTMGGLFSLIGGIIYLGIQSDKL